MINRQKIILSFSLSLALSTVSSCGFLGDSSDTKTIIIDNQALSCEFDTKRLSKITTELVTPDIQCIEAKLHQFAQDVTLQTPGVISKPELSKFVSKFYAKDAEKINGSLDFLFDMTTLLLEDKEGELQVANISKMTALLSQFNQTSVAISKLLNEDSKNSKNLTDFQDFQDFQENRLAFQDLLKNFSTRILEITKGSKKKQHELNILNIALKMKTNFNFEKIDLDLIKVILPFKPIFFQGDTSSVSTAQVNDLLMRLHEFGDLYYQMTYGTGEVYGTGRPILQARDQAQWVKNIKALVTKDRQDQDIIFTSSDLSNLLNQILILIKNDLIKNNENPDLKTKGFYGIFKDVNFHDFKDLFHKFKTKLVNENFTTAEEDIIRIGEAYTVSDIKKILTMAEEMTEALHFNAVSYYNPQYAVNLVKKTKLNENNFNINDGPEEYFDPLIFTEKKRQEYFELFSYITTKYRFFGQPEHIQFINHNYERSLHGIQEIFVIRWAMNKLLSAYGSLVKTTPAEFMAMTPLEKRIRQRFPIYQGSIEQLEKVLTDLKPVLQKINLWPKNFGTFARNALTLSDLFQSQSNGNLKVELEEITEYLALVVTAMEVEDRVQESMIFLCPLQNKELLSGFSPECYRKNFFSTVFERLNLHTYFKPLYEFSLDPFALQRREEIRESKPQWIQNLLELYKPLPEDDVKEDIRIRELADYHAFIENFARDEASEEIPMAVRDRTLVFGAMLNVESVFLLYDNNRDNILDEEELVQAYVLFKKIIAQYAKLNHLTGFLGEDIFLYMIEKKKEPTLRDAWEISKWIATRTFGHKVKAKRINIAGILSYMSKMNAQPRPLKPKLKH